MYKINLFNCFFNYLFMWLVFCYHVVRCRNLVGLPKSKRDGDFVIVGDPLLETETRVKIRSPFEKNCVTNLDLMENVLDYSFSKLGIENQVNHPVLITEPVCNPNYCRARMSSKLWCWVF